MLQLTKFKSTYKIKYLGHEVLWFSTVVTSKKLDSWLFCRLGKNSGYNRAQKVYLVLKYGQQLVKDYTL